MATVARAERGNRYTAVAIFLHWAMALGILALIVIGLVMTHVKLKPFDLFRLYQLHKSIGITILLAAFLRLAWRLMHKPPALPTAMRRRSARLPRRPICCSTLTFSRCL